jgi:nucleotide-binding universal stress UspA family protein
MTTGGKIVVGVDGSCTSQHALAWALREAEIRGAQVEVVYAWSLAAVAHVSPATAIMLRKTDFQTIGHELLQAAVDAAIPSSVEISQVVVEAPPAEALLARAEHADLLVLGAYARNRAVRGGIGSTHEYCVTHADCPVVVVRAAA